MMYKKHCLLVLLIAFFVSANGVTAQSNCSHVVVSTGGYSLSQIDQAFAVAQLDSYRKKTVRRVMQFSNGAEVHLLSASELQSMNCPVNGTLAMEDNQPLDPSRRFEIHASGVLMESTQADYKR